MPAKIFALSSFRAEIDDQSAMLRRDGIGPKAHRLGMEEHDDRRRIQKRTTGWIAQRRRASRMKVFIAIALAIGIAVVGCNRDNALSDSDADVMDTADIKKMDPKEILFTTPTLNDAIPATIQGSKVPADCIQLHEDDWRQFEFIPHSLKSDVDAELADINVIWDDHSVSLGDSGTAFNKVHVRKRIPNPLAIPMPLAEFEKFIGQKMKPMTFFGYGDVLLEVHAIAIDNLVVYAHVQNDTVTALGFDAVDKFTLPPEFATRLSDFVRTQNLMLVHWRSRTLIESHDDVMAYFGIRG